METSKMKKIFIVTGEASGDKLASKVISNLNKLNSNIKYLSVGGENLKKKLFKHQIKKKFQHSLEWEKNQLAIWDNRSMLHQATPFKGNRIMHRITIL